MVIKLRFERGEDRRESDRRENRFGFRLMYDEGGGSKRGCTRFVSIVFIANAMIPAEDRDSCSPPVLMQMSYGRRPFGARTLHTRREIDRQIQTKTAFAIRSRCSLRNAA